MNSGNINKIISQDRGSDTEKCMIISGLDEYLSYKIAAMLEKMNCINNHTRHRVTMHGRTSDSRNQISRHNVQSWLPRKVNRYSSRRKTSACRSSIHRKTNAYRSSIHRRTTHTGPAYVARPTHTGSASIARPMHTGPASVARPPHTCTASVARPAHTTGARPGQPFRASRVPGIRMTLDV